MADDTKVPIAAAAVQWLTSEPGPRSRAAIRRAIARRGTDVRAAISMLLADPASGVVEVGPPIRGAWPSRDEIVVVAGETDVETPRKRRHVERVLVIEAAYEIHHECVIGCSLDEISAHLALVMDVDTLPQMALRGTSGVRSARFQEIAHNWQWLNHRRGHIPRGIEPSRPSSCSRKSVSHRARGSVEQPRRGRDRWCAAARILGRLRGRLAMTKCTERQ